jgi:hypothetical protein
MEVTFEAAIIRLSSSPLVCSPPLLLLPQLVPGRRDFYFSAYLGLLPPRAGDMLTVRIGQLTVRGLSPLKMGGLVGRSRLNHFSLRLRPIVLIALCLIFGITSADPGFSIQRLACLTGTGFSPAGIHDLA